MRALREEVYRGDYSQSIGALLGNRPGNTSPFLRTLANYLTTQAATEPVAAYLRYI